MKKFDLRKTRASTVVDDIADDDVLIYDEQKSSPFDFLSNIEIDPKQIIMFFIKLALCGVGTLILIQHEKKNLEKLAGQKEVANSELNKLTGQKDKLKKKIEAFGHMVKRSKEFDNKLQVMKTIADRRLPALTGLDHIQTVIPEEVWLKSISFDNKKFTVMGMSTTNKQIQNFVEKLERTNLFSEVNLERAAEEPRGNTSYTQRSFTILIVLK